MKDANGQSVFDVRRWGLPAEVVADLAGRLRRVWARFRHCFRNETRDPSEHAWTYLRGLLTMLEKRNFAQIAQHVNGIEDNGQNLQQFISDSPWSERAVFAQIQSEICRRPEVQGGILTLDESGDERAGVQSAGAARQYLGRHGTVNVGQVGVALGYYQDGIWAMVDAELYLPESWFDQAHAELRRRWHIPAERTFRSKRQLGLEMIKRAKASGLPFAVVGCDTLYGQEFEFRASLDAEQLLYMADLPSHMYVYLQQPILGTPQRKVGQAGRPAARPRVLSDDKPVQVRTLTNHPDFALRPVEIRHTERGLLAYPCAARRVWTVKGEQVREEWLFLRRERNGTFTFSLSNAPADTPLEQLALWRSQRYFAERTFQDAKSEAGWDELVARKYRAWVHHTVLNALALWFVAETRLDWRRQHPRDPLLASQLQVEVLPALSMANIRELLQATLPLPQLTQDEATRLVTKHLVHRSHATASRLKKQRHSRDSP
jgi:SRSO17 transposase